MTGTYLVKRVVFAFITILVAITVNFVMFRALPGDAVSGLRCRQCTVEFKRAQIHDLGLDRPLVVQYALYMRGLAHGDLGHSLRAPYPTSSISSRLAASTRLSPSSTRPFGSASS